MKFRKFTATIALTAVLSSSIASSLTPLTVYATDGEAVTAETASEEPKDPEPVQENDVQAEVSAPAAEESAKAENKVEEPKQEEPAPEKNEQSNGGSVSSNAESADKEESKTATEQGTSGETTGKSGTEESAKEESKETTSEEETGSSEASSEASGEAAPESEEGKKDKEKTYALSFESLCGDESLGSGNVSLKLSNDYISIESGAPSYTDYELVSTEVAGYTLSDGKLSGAEDAESVLEGGANVTFRFRSTKPEETSITLHAVARDTDGNEIRKLSDLSYSLKKDETKELSAPSAADFAAETDEEKITYSYVRTEVDGAERNTVTAADDGKTVSFIYKKEAAPKEITVTVHRAAKDTDGNVIADLDDTTLTLKKGESKDLQVPGADTLPKDKKNVSYKYVRTEVNGKETSSVNSEQKEFTAVFYYDKITAVTLKQEAVDTDGKRIEKLDDLKAELKGSEARELKAPEAAKFDTEDAEQKITYTYEKTLVDGKEASKVTASDDGKTITYVYKKTAADKKTKVTLKQEALDTEGNRIKKLDALTLELKKDEKKTLKAPDAKSLLDEKDTDVTYTFEKILVDGKEKDTVTAKDDGKTIQYVYKKEAAEKISRTVHMVAVDDTKDHKEIADLGEKKLTFHGKDDVITLAKIQPDTDKFTKKDEDSSYEYIYSYAELNGEKTAKVTAEDLTKDSTLTFVYQVKETSLPVTRTVTLVIRDTDGKAIKTFARVGVTFESRKAKRTADSFESYAKDVEELKETKDCRYEFKEARLNGKAFEEISAKDVTAGDTLTLVYEKVDKKEAVKVTATAVDENGKTIAGHAEEELPDFDHTLTLDDPEKAPFSIDGYVYVDAKIDDTVITSLKKEKVEGEDDEDDSFTWSYVADGKTVDIEEDTDITLEYQAQKAVTLNVTYVDEFGDPIGDDYTDLALDGDRFDEKNILKLEAGEDKPLQETIQVAQDESGKKIIQYTFEDAFVKVGLKKTEITAIQRTKISGSGENSNGAKYAYAVRYEGSDDFTDLDEDTTVYLQYNGGRKRLYTYEDDSVKVTAILQHADAIPDDAEFVVTPITKDSSDYNYAAYMQALNDNADKLSEEGTDTAASTDSKDLYNEDNTLLYDIAFMGHPTDEDGSIDTGKTIEYQPAEGYVNIEVSFKKDQLKEDLGAEEDQDITVAHLPLKDAVKAANDTTKDASDIAASDVIVEAVDDLNASIDTGIASFKASSFSVFACVVGAPSYGDWTGSEHIKYSDFMNKLGVAGEVAIYAKTLTKNQHIEGTIAVDHLIPNDTQELVSGNRVTTYNMVSSVSVTKNVTVPVKNNTSFRFAFFDSKKKLSSNIYSVELTSGQKSGTTIIDITKDDKAYAALKDQGIDLYLYEVDGSNLPIESGNQYEKYTVTYPDGQNIPAATSTLKNYIGSITMSGGKPVSVGAIFFGKKGVVTYFRDNKPSDTYNSDNISLNILDKNDNAVLTLSLYKQDILENGASGGSNTYLRQLSDNQFEIQSGLNKNLKENGYFSELSSKLANALNGKHSDPDCFNVINIKSAPVSSNNGSFTYDLDRLGYGDPQNNNDQRNQLIGDDSHYLLVNIDCTGCNSYNMGKMIILNRDGEVLIL